MARPRYTTRIYLAKGINPAYPTVEKVFAISPNTPIGANNITIDTNFIINSFKFSKKFNKYFPFSPNMDNPIPDNSANTIIWSILPSAIAWIGFLGTISYRIWTSGTLLPTVTSTTSIAPISKPIPGLNTEPNTSAIIIAIAVVPR